MHWPAAPLGWAQIVELRRTCVRLCYRTCTGRLRFPVTNAAALAAAEAQAAQHDPLLPLLNPLRRAGMGRTKTFAMRKESRGED